MNKAFLKWAGGKSQLLDKLTALMPPYSPKARYIEPFVGSGVIALNMPYKEIIIGDVNPGLMACWQGLKNDEYSFIEDCRLYFMSEFNHEKDYYRERTLFNSIKEVPFTNPHIVGHLFLYLNRHCFNGLCRFNSRCEFNVPFGRYKKPYFPETELLQALKVTKRMTILQQGFMDTMKLAKKGDVIYCDPPYIPSGRTSNFTSYSPGGFSLEMQVELVHCARWAQDKGATVIISNNDVPLAWKLYAGAEIHIVEVAKKISCKADGRKKLQEIIAVFRP